MFHLTRRFQSLLPILWVGAGLMENLALLMLPSLVHLGWLFARHVRIVGLVGVAPWASVGFARHVMVDDSLRLAFWAAISPVPYLVGTQLRHFLLAA